MKDAKENTMILKTAAVAVIAAIMLICTVYAGDLNPSAPPTAGTMKTLDEVQPAEPIDSDDMPMTISESGSYYFTENIHLPAAITAITIEANDVTLDMKGFTLSGPGGGSGAGAGIHASDASLTNIVIANGTVRDFRWYGVKLEGTDHRVTAISALGNGSNGISISGSVLSCTARANGSSGIVISNGTAEGCTTRANQGYGINASSASVINCIATGNTSPGFNGSQSSFAGCIANGNTSYGFSVSDSSLRGCSATENGSDGFYTSSSSLNNCTASSNEDYGIRSYYSSIVGCTAKSNGTDGSGDGIRGQTSCTINGCVAYDNADDGISTLYGGSIMDCSVYDNGEDGISASYKAVIKNCSSANNGVHGIYVAHDCRVEANNLRDNDGWGLKVNNTDGYNYCILNVASDNTLGEFYIPSGNYVPTTGDNANYSF